MASNYFFGSDEELLLGGIPKYFYTDFAVQTMEIYILPSLIN